MKRRSTYLKLAFLLLALYYGISMWAFAFRHPGLTDIERLLCPLEVILWR